MAADWGATDAGRVPLFDRLIDEERHISHEPTPFRTLDRQGVRDSLRRELERLLATRCPVSGAVALRPPGPGRGTPHPRTEAEAPPDPPAPGNDRGLRAASRQRVRGDPRPGHD